MPDRPAVNDWLPAHQDHLLYTLAHADESIEKACSVIYDYVRADPLRLEGRIREGREQVILSSIAPIPQSVPRDAANAINELRNALEHALSSEVEHLMGRSLELAEAKAIEMPIPKGSAELARWFKDKRRGTLTVLHADGTLGKRIAELQPPFGTDEDAVHPLRVLTEHSNLSKHRKPAEYALRLGRIVPDFDVDGLEAAVYADDTPMRAGDVLASVPRGTNLPMDIWPHVGIRRPHTGKWVVLSRELLMLEAWVRTVALPVLIVGTSDVEPIPPHLDTSRAYGTHLEALSSAQPVPAAERLGLRLAGSVLREQLPYFFKLALPDTPAAEVDQFVANLSDTRALEILQRFTNISQRGRGEKSAIIYLRRLFEAGN